MWDQSGLELGFGSGLGWVVAGYGWTLGEVMVGFGVRVRIRISGPGLHSLLGFRQGFNIMSVKASITRSDGRACGGVGNFTYQHTV